MDALTGREALEANRRFRALGAGVNRLTRHNGRLTIVVGSKPDEEVRPMEEPEDFVDFPTPKRAVFERDPNGWWVLLNPLLWNENRGPS